MLAITGTVSPRFFSSSYTSLGGGDGSSGEFILTTTAFTESLSRIFLMLLIYGSESIIMPLTFITATPSPPGSGSDGDQHSYQDSRETYNEDGQKGQKSLKKKIQVGDSHFITRQSRALSFSFRMSPSLEEPSRWDDTKSFIVSFLLLFSSLLRLRFTWCLGLLKPVTRPLISSPTLRDSAHLIVLKFAHCVKSSHVVGKSHCNAAVENFLYLGNHHSLILTLYSLSTLFQGSGVKLLYSKADFSLPGVNVQYHKLYFLSHIGA